MFGFFDMMNNHEQRKVANTAVDGGVVDTCSVTDSSRPFETGIEHPAYNEGKWVIVELYDTREEALAGHEKWVGVLGSRPAVLRDVNECDIQGFARAMGFSLHDTFERGEPEREGGE